MYVWYRFHFNMCSAQTNNRVQKGKLCFVMCFNKSSNFASNTFQFCQYSLSLHFHHGYEYLIKEQRNVSFLSCLKTVFILNSSIKFVCDLKLGQREYIRQREHWLGISFRRSKFKFINPFGTENDTSI